MIFYGNHFSPFSRKVMMVLEHKKLNFEYVDGLDQCNHQALKAINNRLEVPVLVDDDCVVVNSADIVRYLEDQYPTVPVLPSTPKGRVAARAWERLADSIVDAITVDISYWQWAEREDTMPEGMLAAAGVDMDKIYLQLEQALMKGAFLCGQLSIADIALFPHLTAVSRLGIPIDSLRFPKLEHWLQQLRGLPLFKHDLARTREYLGAIDAQNIERKKIFWRGDRIEWLLTKGFEQWLFDEIRAGRTVFPELGVE